MRRSRSCCKRWSGESRSRPWMSVPAGPTALQRQDGRSLPRLPLVRARGRGRRRGSARLQKLLPRAASLIVDNGSVMCMAGYPGVAPRAVFFPSVVKPKMLLLGRHVPEGQLSVAFAWLVLLVMSPLRCVPFYCRQAVWCISWTSCSRPSLCNDRCRSWSGQCSALPVETPQVQFLDEFIVT